MAIKIMASVVAVFLMFAYLLALAFKLKEIDLAIVIAIGLAMMVTDLWQSFKSKDD
jgi:hypothetical protein